MATISKSTVTRERFFQALPGLLTWLVLTSPIWLGRPLPLAVAFFITFLTVFWVYRAFLHLVGMIIGYRRYQRELKIDWQERFTILNGEEVPNRQDLPDNLYDVKHLIVVPLVNESELVISGLIRAIATQSYPLENIYLAFTVEERFHQSVRATIKKIVDEFPNLQNVWVYVHPSGLPGEVRGAASNRTWGAKNAVRDLQAAGLDIRDFIVTTMDGDAVLHQQYLARLAYEFVIRPNRRDLFYQPAVYLMDNNIWEVPTLMRIQAHSVTLATLSGWAMEPFFKETFSCFSLALETLVDANYWDTSISIDDTPLFWRIFARRDGQFSGVAIYTPVSSDAVQGKNFVDSHIQQYKQLLRWGWGIITIPPAMKALLESKKASTGTKVLWFYHFLERYMIWYTIIALITFGFPLLILVNPGFQSTTFSFLLPQITSMILTVALLLLIPAAWFRQKITAPIPESWPLWKKIFIYFEGLLVIIHLYIFVFLPYLEAETRFMVGKTLDGFAFTQKIRTKK